MSGLATESGIYVHIPFCLTRCGYCDFNAYAGLDHLQSRYARALVAEARLTASSWRQNRVTSIFLGGGTPTTTASADLASLLTILREKFDVSSDAEVTIEANPDTVDAASLGVLRSAGYNRLSIGAQSFDSKVLDALERVHQPAAVKRAFAAAREAGFENLNLDLIFGADGETLRSWRETLEQSVSLDPEHVSAYALTIEPATSLGRKVAAGLVPAPNGDLQAEMFRTACDMLGDAGYVHYEVSNWAKPGFECRHNLTYWRRLPYLGLGAGAHSFAEGRRWWNVRPPEQYLETLERGEPAYGGEEHLSAEERQLEELFLHLRTSDGISAAQIDVRDASDLVAEGLLVLRDGAYVLTERGMFLANEVIVTLSA